MKVVVCDDEILFLNKIENYFKVFEKESGEPVTLVKFLKGNDVLDYFEKEKDIDLFVLDIMMPEPNGIKIAETIRKTAVHAKIVFLTSTADFSMKGYEIGITRYWMKPIEYDKFYRELTIICEEIKKESSAYFVEHIGTVIEKVYYDEISFIETIGRKTCVHKGKSGESYESTTRLHDYEKKLDGRFYRCHAGYIVNMSYIDKIENCEVKLSDGNIVFTSKGKRKKFLLAYADYLGNKGLDVLKNLSL